MSIVASRGNDDGIVTQYPACFDPSWITSVGGHSSQSERWNGSNFGIYMDFLAPAEDNQIFTTFIEDYTYFHKTSAAAAHVSGAIGLLRSHFNEPNLNNPDNVQLEPEDFENMFKAAALDLDYNPNDLDPDYQTKVGYDKVSAWGQLKVGELFEMLVEEGYIIKHYTIQPNTPFPDYTSENRAIQLVKEGLREDARQGQYNVRKREITGTFNLGSGWLIDQ